MKNLLIRRLLCATTLFIISITAAQAANKKLKHPNTVTGADPAALVINAKEAKVDSTKDGKTTVRLEGLNPLTVAISGMDKERSFESFLTKDFAEHWNNCEKMKKYSEIGREDGMNSYFAYAKGENNSKIGVHHLDAPPLLTNETKAKQVTVSGMGGVKLLVQDAVYDAENNTITFTDNNPLLKNGKYRDITFVAECFVSN